MGKKKDKIVLAGNLRNDQRKLICDHHYANPNLTQKELGEWAKKEFNLLKAPGQSTISDILKRKEEFGTMSTSDLGVKRRRVVTFPELDLALANWVLQCEDRGVCLNGDMIKAKGKRLADLMKIPEDNQPEFSNGWLQAFQERHNFHNIRLHGEGGSADLEAIELNLPIIIRKTDKYPLRDIYNMDETGLFYSMAPDRTIASRQIEGAKKDCIRLTIALTSNADGTHKLQPFIIGHATKPRCFKKKTGEELGFYYRNNQKAWMTAKFFQEWIEDFDKDMRESDRRVLLILDGASSHVTGAITLTNVEVLKLPPYVTSKIQPMDAGIIASFKLHYRRMQLQHAIDQDEARKSDIYKVDQLKAMRWVKIAWNDVSARTINNCWFHTKIISPRDENGALIVPPPPPSLIEDVEESLFFDHDNELATAELQQTLDALHIRNPMPIEDLLNLEKENTEIHQQFNDDDFIQAATEIDHVENEVIIQPLTGREQLDILHSALQIVEERINDGGVTMKSLRRLQSCIREEVRKEEAENQVQSTLDQFFQRLE